MKQNFDLLNLISVKRIIFFTYIISSTALNIHFFKEIFSLKNQLFRYLKPHQMWPDTLLSLVSSIKCLSMVPDVQPMAFIWPQKIPHQLSLVKTDQVTGSVFGLLVWSTTAACYLHHCKSAVPVLMYYSCQTELQEDRSTKLSLWCLWKDHRNNPGANIWHYVAQLHTSHMQTKQRNIILCYICQYWDMTGLIAYTPFCFTILWCILMWADVRRYSVETVILLMCTQSKCGFWFHRDLTVALLWVTISC